MKMGNIILLWIIQATVYLSCSGMQFADKANLLHQQAWKGNVTAVKELLKDVPADTRLLEGDITPLYRAAQGGHRTTMHELLFNGADVNAEVNQTSMDLDGSPYDLLRYAIRSGDITAVRYLLEAGANISSRSANSGYTPLHDAVKKHRLNISELLIDKGADINADSAEGTPLSIASKEGFLDMIILLTNHRADINGTGNKNPPITEAIKAGKENAAMKLLELGADPNTTAGESGLTAVHLAVKNGLNTITKYLLTKGVANLKDYNGRTPLHLAQNEYTANILLKGGADINAVTCKGETPLHHAAYYGHYSVVEFLVSKGAKLDLLSNETYTKKVSLNEHKKMIKFLLKINYKKNATERMGFTPLSIAIWGSNERIVSFLIKKKAPLNIENSEWSPLHVAAYLGEVDITQELVNAGARINIKDSIDWTPLHKAALTGMTDVVKKLITLGANVNASDLYGWTPLHVAAKYHRLEIARSLIHGGSDANAKDKGGFSILMWAEAGGHPLFLDLMIDRTFDLTSENRYGYLQKMASKDIEDIVKLTMNYKPLIHSYNESMLRQFLKNTIKDLNYNTTDISEKIGKYVDSNIPFFVFQRIVNSSFQKYKEEHLELISIILNKTTDLDKQDDIMGWSALHWAAAIGDIDVVKLLVEKDANYRLKSKLNQTPMYLARQWGHQDIYKYFKKIGAVW